MKLASFALAIAAAAAAFPTVALAQGAPPFPGPRESTLVISGDATVAREPDLARISATIDTNDDDATRSAGKNSAIFEALKTKLSALGIASPAIVTTSFNTNFVPKPPRGIESIEPQRYGFVTSRSLSIAVTPIGSAGKIVDAALGAGVTQVGNVAFELKDRKGAYREALGRAFADARANATALVADSGLRLGAVRRVAANDFEGLGPRIYAPVAMRTMAASPLPPTQIDPGGPIDITAHVTVTYEIRGN